jgi:hypothetical protein
MHDLIDLINAAVATGATTEQKAAGVQACRTIAAALDTEPGKPLVLPNTPPPPPTSRVSVDQVLDLMIARLTTIANERDTQPQPPARPPVALRVPAVARPALPRAATPRRTNPTPKKP